MITSEQIRKLIVALKSRTLTSVRENQKVRVPLIHESEKTYRYSQDDDGTEWFFDMNNIVNVKQYHYNDKWYSNILSADEPERSYGVVRVDHMPYRTFEPLMNKKSFICRLDRLIYDGLCEPVMLFVDRKFVNWYDIDVVYDAGDTYFLLHGTKYNYYDLRESLFHFVILPFSVDFLGVEDDSYWDLYYSMLCEYLQNSIYLNSNGKLAIEVPTVATTYETRNMVYGIGAWLFTQLRMSFLGLLSSDREKSLKNISLVYYEYDDSGNVSYTYTTKFNALDRDVYDMTEYYKVCHMNYDAYISKALFRFDSSTGELDMTNGDLILALIDEDIYTDYIESSDSTIYYSQTDIEQMLFRENYLPFKDGLFYPDCDMTVDTFNNIRIKNSSKSTIEVFTFVPKWEETPITVSDPYRRNYLYQLQLQNLKSKITDDDTLTMLEAVAEFLDFEFTDEDLYADNVQLAYETILAFDPNLLNGLYRTAVETRTFTGTEANTALLSTTPRRGIKIPRLKFKRNEVYVMVFLNGELIDNYYKMIAYPNFFFIPMESEKFSSSDVIEILFFTGIDNKEIHFTMTDNILETCFEDVEDNDNIMKVIDIFEEYIDRKDLKLFCDYPYNILKYKTLIEKSKNIAFNTSYRYKGDLYVYRDAYVLDQDAWVDELSDGEEAIINIMAVEPDSGVIPTNAEQEAESKTYDEVDEDNTIWDLRLNYLADSGENVMIEDLGTDDAYPSIDSYQYTAVSSKKFIYERLYVDNKAYRIQISGRFRYCDNQKQYMLFINGRRMEDEAFLVTIPKYSRPFWGMYLYVNRFVDPDDRIELFYVPIEVININTEDHPITFDKTGYIEAERKDLYVPTDPRFFMYFINGKKIPASQLQQIDSWTLRVKYDTKSLKHFIVNRVYKDIIPDVVDYLQGDRDNLEVNGELYETNKEENLELRLGNYDPLRVNREYYITDKGEKLYLSLEDEYYSKYDALIKFIKESSSLGYDALDDLFNIHVTMTNTESDMIAWDTGCIAIINEIVRDFWVTSGYPYNEGTFVYDYAMDSYLAYDTRGFLALPALDATQYINILKNDIHLLYFVYDPEELIREIGSTIDSVTLEWEFSSPLYSDLIVFHQYINDEEIGTDDRTYTDNTVISDEYTYTFKAIVQNATIEKSITYKFYNGIYYGTIDEDSLQWYEVDDSIYYLGDLFAVEPISGVLPSVAYQEQEAVSLNYLKKSNNIYYDILNEDSEVIDGDPTEETEVVDDGYEPLEVNNELYETNGGDTLDLYPIVGSTSTNRIWGVDTTRYEGYTPAVTEYEDQNDLQEILPLLNYVLQDTATLLLEDYVIGANKYFIYAAPYRLCYDDDNICQIEFIVSDINSDEVINYGKDDHTMPVYTDGTYDDQNCLTKLDSFEMVSLGTFYYTNSYGYTERYCAWRSNGFFTRLYDDYGFHIYIRDKRREYEYLQTEFTDEDTTSTSGMIATALNADGTNITAKSTVLTDEDGLEVINLEELTYEE